MLCKNNTQNTYTYDVMENTYIMLTIPLPILLGEVRQAVASNQATSSTTGLVCGGHERSLLLLA
jgi:hypothetical protein